MSGVEVVATRGFYRPAGNMTFQQAVDFVAEALKHARLQGLADILVNTSQMAGFEPPCTIERYAMITRWVESAGNGLRIAVVARAAFIDPQKIGTVIAQNRGVSIEAFIDEGSALRWLDARRTRSGSARPVRSHAAGY